MVKQKDNLGESDGLGGVRLLVKQLAAGSAAESNIASRPFYQTEERLINLVVNKQDADSPNSVGYFLRSNFKIVAGEFVNDKEIIENMYTEFAQPDHMEWLIGHIMSLKDNQKDMRRAINLFHNR